LVVLVDEFEEGRESGAIGGGSEGLVGSWRLADAVVDVVHGEERGEFRVVGGGEDGSGRRKRREEGAGHIWFVQHATSGK
jgi:hypothetical protein